MNTNMLKKALTQGLPVAGVIWLIYGVFTSFFDDTVFEQMFKGSGILFAVFMAAAAVGFFYHKMVKTEMQQKA